MIAMLRIIVLLCLGTVKRRPHQRRCWLEEFLATSRDKASTTRLGVITRVRGYVHSIPRHDDCCESHLHAGQLPGAEHAINVFQSNDLRACEATLRGILQSHAWHVCRFTLKISATSGHEIYTSPIPMRKKINTEENRENHPVASERKCRHQEKHHAHCHEKEKRDRPAVRRRHPPI